MAWKTKRLLVRRARWEDRKAYCRMRNSEYVMKYNVMQEEPEEKLWEQVAEDVASDRAFYLEDLASGKLVGAVWLAPDTLRYGVEAASLEYFLSGEYGGRGLMTEALESVVAYGFERLGLEVISARVFGGNVGSQRVLEKLGFTQEGLLRRAIRGHGGVVHNDMLFSLLREDWESRQG